jgi:hypothetical protein
MNEKEWFNDEKVRKAQNEGKEEFQKLQIDLVNLLVNFCLRALKTFEAGVSEELNSIQINQVCSHEIQSVTRDLLNPKFADTVIRLAEKKFMESKEAK